METVLRTVITLSVTINCPYDKAFNYLSIPINQKEWAIHFYEDIEAVNNKYIASLSFGKLPMEIKSNHETGTLDIYLGDGNPTCTRLINIEKNTLVYNFTLAQPKDMPENVWNNVALPNMKAELDLLKSILENK